MSHDPSAPKLVVTGSTGRLGGRVASQIADAGLGQRLLVRDPSRAPHLPHTSTGVATYGDFEAVRHALDGARLVFMVSAAESPDRVEEHKTFIDAAVSAGVEHLVYTSFFAASPDAVFTLAREHWSTEQHIRSSRIGWTFLRDNFYLDFLPLMTGPDGVIRGPAGDGRVSAVAISDVADVAAAILQDPAPHVGQTYSLTGPRAISLAEVADLLTRSTGEPVTYHDETVEEAYASRAAYGAPEWQVDAWVSTYTSIASGGAAEVTNDVPRITGHAATSLADLVPRRV